MGLFTLHNCCVSWLLNFLKLKLDSQCCLTIPEFSGYHRRNTKIDPKFIFIKIVNGLLNWIFGKSRQKNELKLPFFQPIRFVFVFNLNFFLSKTANLFR